MEFKKVKLGEISIITMGQSPKSEFYSEIDGTPFLQGNRTFQHIYPVIDTYTKKVTKLANANDILFSVRAPVGDINIAPVDLCIGRGLCAIRSINNNQEFLFYLLKSKINELESQATGTIFSSVNKKTLENFIVNIPNEKQQKHIGTILSNLDKKIELNQKIIANLEELSQALFKRWFVDFEFPDENGNPYKSSGGEMIDSELGKIPRDWEVNELGNYVDIIKGLSYKGAFLDKQHERSDSFPLLSISNFNFISGFKSNKTKYYFGDYKERHLVNPGDILIAATDLTQDRKILGAPAIVPNLNKTMIFSLDVFKITETTIPKYVLYFLLQSAKYREFVEGSATGTTVIRIAKNVILKVPIVIDKDISLYFDKLIKPYMEKIEHLSQENQKLTQLRDTLLPKLMSGELEIPDDVEVNTDELSI
ncbi:restriction endonuclease subunit S [Staphylococcus haemolyticus]|uniref:restriction endonuclease subunit S n=1 Tax=Staphylococcus TaxID=1279 RepID=UPI001F0A6155|nr:restriction endonuclease subunit S [Staphylococcus haemolyticus]HCU8828468.1 restriction endonuclease subunit S [Staphylococcus aureus]MCH4497895.1 restriction endonuclease subunit S [Staphylococcus haemolyticus]MCH4507630.1 restriction endonuclease subunit S [Staphylococcus haemolyticus]MDO0969385.1 restriction endonuclease subunit S [Staphylococcus haemolyticus]HCU8829527.1 restriction endonuclease subunit S [Staphylococcus aureus]